MGTALFPDPFSYHIFPLQQDTSLLGIEHVENTHFIARIRIHIDEIGVALIIAYKFVSGRFLALYGDYRQAGGFYAEILVQFGLRFAFRRKAHYAIALFGGKTKRAKILYHCVCAGL